MSVSEDFCSSLVVKSLRCFSKKLLKTVFWFHTALNKCNKPKPIAITDNNWSRRLTVNSWLWRSCSSDGAQFGETRDFGKAWTREEQSWKVGQHPVWNPASPHQLFLLLLLLLFTSLLPFPSLPAPLCSPRFMLPSLPPSLDLWKSPAFLPPSSRNPTPLLLLLHLNVPRVLIALPSFRHTHAHTHTHSNTYTLYRISYHSTNSTKNRRELFRWIKADRLFLSLPTLRLINRHTEAAREEQVQLRM